MRVNEVMPVFFEMLEDRNRSKATIAWYKTHLRHVEEMFFDKNVCNITQDNLREWRQVVFERQTRNGKPPTNRTKNSYIKATRRFFNWLKNEGKIEENPAIILHVIDVDNTVEKAISLSDFSKMVTVARIEKRLREVAIMLFLLGTASRVASATSMKMHDLSLEKGIAKIKLKSQKKERWGWAFLDDPVIVAMNEYVTYHRPENGEDYVFLSKTGKGITRQTVWLKFRDLARDAEVESNWNPHAFRHGFSVHFLEEDGDISALSRILGHSSIEITQEYYARWRMRGLKTIHDKYSPLRNFDIESVNKSFK